MTSPPELTLSQGQRSAIDRMLGAMPEPLKERLRNEIRSRKDGFSDDMSFFQVVMITALLIDISAEKAEEEVRQASLQGWLSYESHTLH